MTRTTLRRTILWLATAAAGGGGAFELAAEDDRTVVLRPGQNIQAIVTRHPPGTRFLFEPGLYRQQTICPKSRQEFIGQDGVVMSGAMELTTWSRKRGIWRAVGLPYPLSFHGECEDGGDLCKFQEDLFFDGRVFKRVRSLDDLGPGRWYFESGKAYLADDPTGQSVELGVTPLAFGGDAEDVVLRDLIIEKYASDAQEGAIHIPEARGWRILNVTASWNHGTGLSFGANTRVTGGSFSHNGQLGIAGVGEGSRIEGVQIAYNNYAGYDAKWEAGGTKFWGTRRLVVRNSCVHHNAGPGLWTDNDNVNTLYEANRVFMNADDGIKHEVSYDAKIRYNIVARNGTSGFDEWLWGSQILIQNSSNVDVDSNLIEVSAQFGNGIGVIHQDRGEGAYGPWHAVNNSVHGNEIIHLGGRGQNGIVTDTGDKRLWREGNNVFDRNTYIVADPRAKHWTSRDRDESWNNVARLGIEQNGGLIVEQRTPTVPSCE